MAAQILELESPVEDQQGYVYEQAAILEYIRREEAKPAPRGHTVHPCACPVAGTTHVLTAHGMRPARAVKREMERRARRGNPATLNSRRNTQTAPVLDLG